jgi:hypothetical protein
MRLFTPPPLSGPTGIPSSGGSGNDAEIAELRFEVERLRIVAEALWRIVHEKLGLDERELIRQMTAIDLEDGKLDGRVAPTPPIPCPKCQRTLAKNRPRCLFCGEPIAVDPFQR